MSVVLKNQESYYSIDDRKKYNKSCKVDEVWTGAEEESLQEELSEVVQQVNSREVADGLLGAGGQEDGVEGELGAEIQLDQQSDAEEDDSLYTHHGIFPIIEVSSGKKQ